MALFRTIPQGDLALDESGNYMWIDGLRHRRQQIQTRFRTFLGEWILDKRIGVPYFRDVFLKNPNRDVVRSVFREVLNESPGVLSIARFDITLDDETRELRFDFECVTDAGALTVSATDEDFVLFAS